LVAEVAAAVELATNARNTIHELLGEDPAFALTVQAALTSTRKELYRGELALTSALRKARDADEFENWGSQHNSKHLTQ